MCWHLNQQPVPTYPFINQKNYTSSSMKRHRSKSSYYKESLLDRSYIRSQYPSSYRTCLIRERTITLSSIPEE
jgi:hypothetical protein